MSAVPPLPDPRLRVVVDPDDTQGHHQAFTAYADLSAGRVVGQVRPGMGQNPGMLAAAVLEALGKDLDLRGSQQGGMRTRWERCRVWLLAEKTQELVVLRAQWLNRWSWRRLVELAAEVDCGLTLVVSGCELDGWRKRMATELAFEPLTATDWVCRHRPVADAKTPTAPGTESFPALPEVDFTLFRANCRRLLPAELFARVDDCWQAANQRTLAWLRDLRQVDELVVSEYLRELVRTAGSLGEVLARLRGAQVAFFLHGWLLRVSHERLAASADHEPYGLLTSHTAMVLRGFVTPRYPALATLSLLLREPPVTLIALRLSDVAPDGSTVALRGRDIAVPDEFRVFLHAQGLQRSVEGAAADDAFFATTRWPQEDLTPTAMTDRAVQQALKRANKETGVLIGSQLSAHPNNVDAVRWARRRGLCIQRLRPSAESASQRAPA